jgi:hypothetical protein
MAQLASQSNDSAPQFRAPNESASAPVNDTASVASSKVHIGEYDRVTYYVWYPENLNVNDVLERLAGSISPAARQCTTLTPKKRTFHYFSAPVTCCYILVETIGKYRSQIHHRPIYLSHGNGQTTMITPRMTNNPRTWKRIGYEVPFNLDRKKEDDWSGTVMERMMRRAGLDPLESQFFFAQNGEPIICIVNYYLNDKHLQRDLSKEKTFQEFGCRPSRPGRRLTDTNFKLEYSPSQMQQMLNELDQYSNAPQPAHSGPLELDDVLFNNYEQDHMNGLEPALDEDPNADHPMYVQPQNEFNFLDAQLSAADPEMILQSPIEPISNLEHEVDEENSEQLDVNGNPVDQEIRTGKDAVSVTGESLL